MVGAPTLVAPPSHPQFWVIDTRDSFIHVRVHIKPALGALPIDKVTPRQVQSFLNGRTESGLSPKSVRYIRGTLRTALNHAMRWGLVTRNAAALSDGPRLVRYEINPLTPAEARQFLDAVRGDRLEALYSVALTMGLRQGEALGLRWQDIDLDRGFLRVETTSTDRPGSSARRTENQKKSTHARYACFTLRLSVRHRQRQLDERSQATAATYRTSCSRPQTGGRLNEAPLPGTFIVTWSGQAWNNGGFTTYVIRARRSYSFRAYLQG